jgi:hypothetical protein
MADLRNMPSRTTAFPEMLFTTGKHLPCITSSEINAV